MGNYSEIEKILLQDPHVIRIEPAEEWEFHNINCSIFKNHQEIVKSYLCSLQNFLKRPYIIDDFTKHPMREKWRYIEVPQKYDRRVSEYLKHNALRWKNMLAAFHCIDVINKDNYCGTNTEQFQKILDELKEACRTVGLQTDVTPIEVVKSLKQKVYSLMEFLSNQSPLS